jgi:ATP-dependent Lon protease
MSEPTVAVETKAAEGERAKRPATPDELPLLPLREAVLFPQAVLPLAVARPASVRLVDEAVLGSRLIGVVTQRDASQEAPTGDDLHGVGTVAVVHKMLKQPDGTIRLVIQGLERFRIVAFTQRTPYFKARIDPLPDVDPAPDDIEAEALARQALATFQRIVELSPMLADELATLVASAGDAGQMADLIAAVLPSLTSERKQVLLETSEVKARLGHLVEALAKEAEVLEQASRMKGGRR